MISKARKYFADGRLRCIQRFCRAREASFTQDDAQHFEIAQPEIIRFIRI
jgi:hypothetical protein